MKIWHKHYLILVILSIIWGSSFILMKRSLESFTALEVASLRIFIAFVSLLPFVFNDFSKLRKSQIVPLIIVGFLGNAVPAFLFALSQEVLNSSFVGTLNSLTPIFTLLFGWFFFGNDFSLSKFYGVLIGLFGSILLFLSGSSMQSDISFPVFYVIIATMCYAISINVIREKLDKLPSIAITSISFLFIGPIAGIFVGNIDLISILNTESGFVSFNYIVVLSLVCTSFPVILFNILVKKTSSVFASSVTYLIPVVAIFWGMLDNELIKFSHFLSMAIILLGIYIVNDKK
ncbi:MAG: EamA family transporter [Flavobacteriales bacterium]|nr:EamA family transporter [Flavobacteriales bacterium]|tara:strand:+ start:344 stop:1210 length:867 start_codon:yes stop_codon:yes gene_type:complete